MSLLKDDHRYSYSQLSSFSECPFGYYLKHIEGVEDKSNAFAEHGTLVHDILDKWAKKQINIKDMATEFERRYGDEVVTSFPRFINVAAYYGKGLEYFKSFNGFPGYEIVSAEEKFEQPLRLTNGTTRPFIAFVDLILRDEFTGGLVVMDHKSKSWTEFKKHRDEMYKQQYLYSYFVHEKYNEWPVQLGFNLFKEPNKLDFQDFSMDTFNEVMQWATDEILKIESFDILDWMECKEQKTPGKPDMFCGNICSSRAGCPNSITR